MYRSEQYMPAAVGQMPNGDHVVNFNGFIVVVGNDKNWVDGPNRLELANLISCAPVMHDLLEEILRSLQSSNDRKLCEWYEERIRSVMHLNPNKVRPEQ